MIQSPLKERNVEQPPPAVLFKGMGGQCPSYCLIAPLSVNNILIILEDFLGAAWRCFFITQAIKLFSLSSTEAPKKLIWGAQDWEPLIDLSNIACRNREGFSLRRNCFCSGPFKN
jgi:hypothetical protein